MKRLFFIYLIILIVSGLLTACNNPHMEGIVLEVSDDTILLSQNLTANEYEEIKDESVKTLQKEDVFGERDSLNLIELTYDEASSFNPGDEVKVWITGDILESYPGQATAKKFLCETRNENLII